MICQGTHFGCECINQFNRVKEYQYCGPLLTHNSDMYFLISVSTLHQICLCYFVSEVFEVLTTVEQV